MFHKISAFILLIVLTNFLSGIDGVREEIVISPRFTLAWDVTDLQTIKFETVVETIGWTGLGLSATGSMAGADIFIAGIQNGNSYSGDYHGLATSNGEPIIDAQQDWRLTQFNENGTHTFLAFERNLDTGDTANDIQIKDENIFLIWAIGETDAVSYHGSTGRGAVELNLINRSAIPTTTPTATTNADSKAIWVTFSFALYFISVIINIICM